MRGLSKKQKRMTWVTTTAHLIWNDPMTYPLHVFKWSWVYMFTATLTTHPTHWPDHPQTTPLILTGDPTELTNWMRKLHNCIACNNCTNKRWMQLCVRCSCYRMAHCRMNKMNDYNFWTRWMSREDNVDSEWLWRGVKLVFMVKRIICMTSFSTVWHLILKQWPRPINSRNTHVSW